MDLKTKRKLLAVSFLLLISFIIFLYTTLQNVKDNFISKETYEKEKKALNDSLELSRIKEGELKKRMHFQMLAIDSLDKKQKQIAEQTEIIKDSIDNILAGDSTKALRENRNVLLKLGIAVSDDPFLTNYEMGWNAKFLNENYGLKLQLRLCNEENNGFKNALIISEEILAEKEKQITFSDSLQSLADKTIESLSRELEYQESPGLSIVGGYGAVFTDKLNSGVFVGIGYEIYKIRIGRILGGIF